MGADKNAQMVDQIGQTPVDLACRPNRTGGIGLQGADPYYTFGSNTPIDIAIVHKSVLVLEEIFKHEVDSSRPDHRGKAAVFPVI